jgi:hypothetical protein
MRARAAARPFGVASAASLDAVRTIRAPLGPPQYPWEEAWFDATLERVRNLLGEAPADEQIRRGSRMPEQTIGEALRRTG